MEENQDPPHTEASPATAVGGAARRPAWLRIGAGSRLRSVLLWVTALIVLWAGLGFLVAPSIVRTLGERELTRLLDREVRIGQVAVNPFVLSVELRAVSLRERDGGDAAQVESLYLNLESSSLVHGGVVASSLRARGVQIKLRRDASGRFNWSDVIERLLNQPPSDSPLRFALHNIELATLRAEFDDQVLREKHLVEEVALAIPFISNLPAEVDTFVKPSLSGILDGARFALGGTSKPFSTTRESSLSLKLDALNLPRYTALSPVRLPFLLSRGQLSADIALTFAQPAGKVPMLKLSGRLGLSEVALEDRARAPLFRFARLDIDVGHLEPLARRLEVSAIKLSRPELSLGMDADGRVNLATLLPDAKPEAKVGPKPEPSVTATPTPWTYRFAHIEFHGGRLQLRDASVSPALETQIDEIEIALKNLGSDASTPAELTLSAHTDDGTRLSHAGQINLSAKEGRGRITLDTLQLARYTRYPARIVPELARLDGQLSAQADYELKWPSGHLDGQLQIRQLGLSGLRMQLRGSKEPLVSDLRLDVTGGRIDLATRQLVVDTISMSGGGLALARERDGRFNLAGLLPSGPAPSTPTDAGTTAWSYAIGKLSLRDTRFGLEDRSATTPRRIDIDQTVLSATGVSSARGARAQIELAARINRRGKLALGGAIGLQPQWANLKLDARAIDVTPVEPYLTEYFEIGLSRGELSAQGRLEFQRTAGGSPVIRYRGELGIANVRTLDRINAEEFVRLKNLGLSGIEFQSEPLVLSARELTLDDFRTRLILNEKGELNLRELDVERAPPQPPAAATAPATHPAGSNARAVVRIDRIAVSGGDVMYSDRFIKPNFSARIVGLKGTVSGLSSDPSKTATLDMSGRVDGSAPVAVSGALNPLRPDPFLDLRASVRDFDLPAVSTYSGKYVGYGIERGKLSADLQYKIEQGQLLAQNRIVLNRLTFGHEVDSPTAVKLPVKLAVALLEDSNGEIELDLPVSGTLNDPQFSVGGLVFKALLNLIGKALTSPFRLLGSMFGGEAEIAYVDFAPGMASLGPEAVKKLEALTRALTERPGLRLEVAGRVATTSDRIGLKQADIRRQVRRLKAREARAAAAQGATPTGPSTDVALDDEEYARWLRRLYDASDITKPRNLIGFAKTLPVAEMEALLREQVSITDEALQDLGMRRAREVKSWLVEKGAINPERIFVVAPRLDADEGKDEAGGRAEFALR